MNIKMTLHSAEELTAAAAFCTALAEARRKEASERPPYGFGIDRASAAMWKNIQEAGAEGVTAGEVVDALHGALKAETTAEDADGVEFPAAATEPPKKRGRPRKEAPVIDAEPQQLDIEEAIAEAGPLSDANAVSIDDDPKSPEVTETASSGSAQTASPSDAPQPEDPAVGWTTQDARNAGRALLDRAPDVDTGNRKLAATLVPFGVQQVKALQPDQIEAFVVATQKAVF